MANGCWMLTEGRRSTFADSGDPAPSGWEMDGWQEDTPKQETGWVVVHHSAAAVIVNTSGGGRHGQLNLNEQGNWVATGLKATCMVAGLGEVHADGELMDSPNAARYSLPIHKGNSAPNLKKDNTNHFLLLDSP